MSPSNERELLRLTARLRLVLDRAERLGQPGRAEVRVTWSRGGQARAEVLCLVELLDETPQPECFADPAA